MRRICRSLASALADDPSRPAPGSTRRVWRLAAFGVVLIAAIYACCMLQAERVWHNESHTDRVRIKKDVEALKARLDALDPGGDFAIAPARP